MFESERKSSEGLVQTDILHNQQIGSLSLEEFVFLFLYNEINISSFSSRYFIGHSLEGNLLVVGRTLFHMNLNDLSFVLGLGLVSLSVTIAAGSLHLRQHSRSYLSQLHDHTLSTASVTRGGFSHNDLAVDGKLDGFSIVQIIEADLEWVLKTGSLSWAGPSASAAAAKEHGKQVVTGTGSAARASLLFDSLEAILVVNFTLLLVRQNFVSGIHFLEHLFVSTLIGVVLQTKLSVGLLDGLWVGILLNTKNLVQLGRIDVLTAAGHAAHTAWHTAKWHTSGHSSKVHCILFYCNRI
mmetsp:Transcript_448/g.1042  ORF Transcript_448/g.1042 Transcript_448/m.1042 type:complete len:296 (-) Transcript_448:113-1000(-)